jgi:hypothetical protein
MKSSTSLTIVAFLFAGTEHIPIALAHELAFIASLSGLNETPPNGSPGAGYVIVTLDLDENQMQIEATFSDLAGTVSGVHIHSPTPTPGSGVADAATPASTLPSFPAGVTSGVYDNTLEIGLAEAYNPAFIASSGGTVGDAFNSLIFSLSEGKAYFDIHTSSYADGEIRGFLLPDPKTDFDHDGVVGAGDLAVWKEAFNVNADGDANDDEASDAVDFMLWQRQVGFIAQLPLAAVGVPEPSVLSMTSLIAAILLRSLRWNGFDKLQNVTK